MVWVMQPLGMRIPPPMWLLLMTVMSVVCVLVCVHTHPVLMVGSGCWLCISLFGVHSSPTALASFHRIVWSGGRSLGCLFGFIWYCLSVCGPYRCVSMSIGLGFRRRIDRSILHG